MATISIQFSHPQLTHTETLTVPDAKVVEFADLLRNFNYPPEGDPPVAITRAAAITRWCESYLNGVRGYYKRLKEDEAKSQLTPPDEIDA